MSDDTRPVAPNIRPATSSVLRKWDGSSDGSFGLQRQQSIGIGGLLLAQTLDLLTTIYGLSIAGVVEMNPVAVAAMNALGTVPGLVFLMSCVLCAVVAVTETLTRYCDGTVLTPLRVRCLGYAPLTLFTLAAVVHNLAVISAA